MEYFQVRYDSSVVIYERRAVVTLATVNDAIKLFLVKI